jgi:hypothetical protein
VCFGLIPSTCVNWGAALGAQAEPLRVRGVASLGPTCSAGPSSACSSWLSPPRRSASTLRSSGARAPLATRLLPTAAALPSVATKSARAAA